MYRKSIVFVLAILVSATFLTGEENAVPEHKKIETRGNGFYLDNTQLNSTSELEKVIRSINDEEADEHLDRANSLLPFVIVCAVCSGITMGSSFGVMFGGGGLTWTLVVAGTGLGIGIVAEIFAVQATGEIFAAIERYNTVVDERQEISFAFGLMGNGIGIHIRF